MFYPIIQYPGLLLIQTRHPSEREKNWIFQPDPCSLPAFLLKERVCVHTQVWSWHTSQKQQARVYILRAGKCSWVLQFTHTHGVPNRVYSHEGTLSAGVNLYHSTTFKGIAYFHTKKEQSLTTFGSCVCVVFCFSDKHSYFLKVWLYWLFRLTTKIKSHPSTFHHTVSLLRLPLPKGSVTDRTFLFLERSFETQQSSGLFLAIEGGWKTS